MRNTSSEEHHCQQSESSTLRIFILHNQTDHQCPMASSWSSLTFKAPYYSRRSMKELRPASSPQSTASPWVPCAPELLPATLPLVQKIKGLSLTMLYRSCLQHKGLVTATGEGLEMGDVRHSPSRKTVGGCGSCKKKQFCS